MKFYLDFITQVDATTLHVEGYLAGSQGAAMYVQTSQEKIELKANSATHGHPLGGSHAERVEVVSGYVKVASGADKLSFLTGSGQLLAVGANPYTGLASISPSYVAKGELLLQKRPKGIVIRKNTWLRRTSYETFYLVRILFNWRVGAALDALRARHAGGLLGRICKAMLIVGEAIVMIPRAIVLRLAYYVGSFMKNRRGKTIWLISDRGMAAGDNGEAFFRYLSTNNDDEAREVYFGISSKSSDYARLKRYGRVLDMGSLAYKMKFLLADKVISSHADVEVTNPFLRQRDHFVGLYGFDFVFLQHGIIRADLSTWLNRYERNIDLFITSAKKEYDSIFSHPYYYDSKNVALTGLPRYDLLESKPERKLIIAPTYRKDLLRLKTDKYGARGYDKLFNQSDYFQFYSRLIGDKRLHKVMQEAGMMGEFYLHPNFASQRSDFRENDFFRLPSYPYDYKKAFEEGSLFVSDYSSTVFDFAYLKKPVIYAQFDIDTFFDQHTSSQSDFFSDESDGFGPVVYTYEDTLQAIIDSIEGGCKMSETYQKRVDAFYYKRDRNNSERVYRAIMMSNETGSV